MEDLFSMDQFVDDFIEEAKEIVENLDKELIKLEKEPENIDLLNSIFRSAHTLKGSAGFLNFSVMKELTHKIENLFDKLRNNELKLSTKIMDILFESMDSLKEILDKIINERNDKLDIEEIVEKLIKITEIENVEIVEIKDEFIEEETELKEEIISEEENNEEEKEYKKEDKKIESKKLVSYSIRVDTRRIDKIMNLVSELVTGRNRLLQIGKQFNSGEFTENSAFIGRLVTELQSTVMKIRMVPLEKVFSRFPRVVRDLAKKLGKQVEFDISGEETELDKTVSEEIYDPLVHMLRNALDHGVEMPNDRIKKGKNPVGKIKISAKQEENFVYIEISDDGNGINSNVIRKKAIEKELVSEEEAQKLTEYEIINFIFHPGFSTAEIVSDVSGRGVGMDVVKTSIEKLGGIVDVITEYGKGSTFRIRLPLTLAIMQVLIIEVGYKRYALPLNSVIETVRVKKSDMQKISGRQVMFLRGKPIPIVYLSSVYDIEEYEREDDKLNIVVLGLGEKRTGLVIDEMHGNHEIVIKSLGKYLGKVEGIAGSAILGDGSIIMILDSAYIVRQGKSVLNTENNNLENQKRIKRKKILYVDDSTTLQKMMKRLLEDKGYKIDIAGNGQEGLRKIEANKYDVIISDFEMPIMNGYDFIENLREKRGYKYIPVIILSGKINSIDNQKWMDLDITSYMEKPIKEEELIKLLENID